LEAEAVEDLELGLFLAQIIILLQHDHFEHQHRTPRGASALRAAPVVELPFQIDAEKLPVHAFIEPAQRGGPLAQGFLAFLIVEQSSLLIALLYLMHQIYLHSFLPASPFHVS
jgi:hypothetical protein